jgi:8-oxo-dGTP pyrophosphatase MutT (NUDIX family)
MKQLFAIDLHDYREGDRVFSRPSARGIILRHDKIALVYSRREAYYKFPGGGIRADEDKRAALIREVREEVGLTVIPDSIVEYGSVMRRQKSNVSPDTIFEQENFYYFCSIDDTVVPQHLDDYEKQAEFTLRYVSIDEAIRTNEAYQACQTCDGSDCFDAIMIRRETEVLRRIRSESQTKDGFFDESRNTNG